jgi:hypothetical protein
LAKTDINKQLNQNAGLNGATAQASSLNYPQTIAYFNGKINHLAIITVGLWLAANI